MTMKRVRATALVGVPLLIAQVVSCDDDVAAPGFEVRLGNIVYYDEGPELEYPDMVDAGVPFTVEVTTFGNGCYSKARDPGDLRRRPRALGRATGFGPARNRMSRYPAGIRSFRRDRLSRGRRG